MCWICPIAKVKCCSNVNVHRDKNKKVSNKWQKYEVLYRRLVVIIPEEFDHDLNRFHAKNRGIFLFDKHFHKVDGVFISEYPIKVKCFNLNTIINDVFLTNFDRLQIVHLVFLGFLFTFYIPGQFDLISFNSDKLWILILINNLINLLRRRLQTSNSLFFYQIIERYWFVEISFWFKNLLHDIT